MTTDHRPPALVCISILTITCMVSVFLRACIIYSVQETLSLAQSKDHLIIPEAIDSLKRFCCTESFTEQLSTQDLGRLKDKTKIIYISRPSDRLKLLNVRMLKYYILPYICTVCLLPVTRCYHFKYANIRVLV